MKKFIWIILFGLLWGGRADAQQVVLPAYQATSGSAVPTAAATPLPVRVYGGTNGQVLTSNGTYGIFQTTSGGGGSTAISALTSGTATNTIDSTLFAQSWIWSTATTQTPLALTATSLTTGSLLTLTTTAGATALNIVGGNCVGCSPISALYYTTTNRTVAASDVNNLISYNNAAAGSWTVPNAGFTGFTAPNSAVYISNIGAGALTLTSTSSVYNGLGGTTTASLSQNQWAFCVPDASNNYDCVSSSGSGSGTVNSGTAKQVAYYASTGSTLSGTNVLQFTTTSAGINTGSPTATLHVKPSASGQATLYVESTGNGGPVLKLLTDGSGGHNWQWSANDTSNGANVAGTIQFYDGTANKTPLTISGTGQFVTLAGGVYTWASDTSFPGLTTIDTGISRDSANVIDFGNGTQGDKSASIQSKSWTGTFLSITSTVAAGAGFTGVHSTTANALSLSTTGSDALTINSSQQVSIPNMTQSSAAQTGTVCWASTGLTYDATVGCLTSTKENKEKILSFSGGLAEVMKLKPISFYYKDKKMDATEELGLLAEDVVQVEPRLVGYGSDGKLRGVRYEQLTAVLISAIQDQQKEIEDLRKQIGHR